VLSLRTLLMLPLIGALSAAGCSSITTLEDDTDGGSSSTGMSGSTGFTSALTTAADSADPSATSGTTSAESTAETSSGDDGCNFVDCETSGGPFVDECNHWENDCPDGEKCTFWANDGGGSWNATRCVPIADDPATAGEPCTAEGSGLSGIDNCEAGAMCWGLDPETELGECIPLCSGSPDNPMCDEPDQYCSIHGGPLAICLSYCDPLDPEACAPNQGCYPAGAGYTVCIEDASEGGGGVFDGCEYDNLCMSGNLCLPENSVGACQPGDSQCCTPWCDLAAPDCPAPTSCQPFYPDDTAPKGHENVGVCALAMR